MMKTRVPEKRPTRIVVGLHGKLELYAALSDKHQADGERLRSVRCELNVGLREAANLLGLTPVDLSECERGVREFDIEEALALLRRK